MTTSTIVTTTSATTNLIQGDSVKNVIDYSATVSKLKIDTLVKLAHSSEFKGEFKPLAKAKNPANYMEAVIERLNDLIVEGKLPVEFTLIPGMDKDVSMVEQQINASLRGMVKLPQSPEQKATRKLQTFVEKFISFGKLASRMMDLYPKVTGEEEFAGHWFQIKKFAKEHTNGANKDLVRDALKCAEDMGIKDVMVAQGKVLSSVNRFIRTTGINTSYVKGIISTPIYNGLKANVTVRKNSKTVLDLLTVGRWVSQATYAVNETVLSGDYLNAISRILIVAEDESLHRYNVKPYIGAKGTDLRSICGHLSLNTMLSVVNLLGVEMSSLLADDRNFVIINFDSYTFEDKAGIERTVKKYIVSVNPYLNSVIFKTNEEHSFWGISSPDTLSKGIIRAISGTPGFAEITADGGYRTIVGKANKMVARTIKLVKNGDKLAIPRVAVVVDACENDEIVAALSTGSVHTTSNILRSEGQCRIVSDATQGGVKATFGYSGFLDPMLDVQGITVASFGSLKSNLYGINCVLGLTANNVSELPVRNLKVGKAKVKVVFLPEIEVTITNNYLINNFVPVNRDGLIRNWDEANMVLANRIAEKATTVREDDIFVEYVKDLRDSEYAGDLVACLKSLLIQGVIKAKEQQVSITSSEYDVMSYTMGREKAIEFQNNMLMNEHNKDDLEKDLMFRRAFEHNAGTQSMSSYKCMSAVDMYRAYIDICNDNGISLKSAVGSFASRDLLVDLCTKLFSDEGGLYNYVLVGDAQSSIYIPVGNYMSGSFHKTSTVFDDKVSVTGFLSKFLKHVAYGADALESGVYSPEFFAKFVSNLTNELTVDLIGKKLGKLTATGFYGVMQPAWWTKAVDKVFSPGFKTIKGMKECLLAKHPELLEDSLTGATAVSTFPKSITKGISADVLDVVEFAFQTTIFVAEDMLLGVLNDCDGDILRATQHKGMSFPHFEGRSLKDTYFAHKWHRAYKADEQAFATVKPVTEDFHTIGSTMTAINDSAYAKACVALFTSNAQRLAQRVVIDAEDNKTYQFAQRIMNIWVQVFAMNAIKQQSGGSKGSVTLMLPEYFAIWDLHTEIRGIGADLFEEFLVNTMEIDMADHGYKNNRDFIEQFTVLLESIQDISAGSLMVGKDISIAEAAKGFTLDLSSLNGKILQDRLVLAYAKKLGLI